jgi:hypothetical protein
MLARKELMLTTPGSVSVSTTSNCEPDTVLVYEVSTQLKPPYAMHWDGSDLFGIEDNANRSTIIIATMRNAKE